MDNILSIDLHDGFRSLREFWDPFLVKIHQVMKYEKIKSRFITSREGSATHFVTLNGTDDRVSLRGESVRWCEAPRNEARVNDARSKARVRVSDEKVTYARARVSRSFERDFSSSRTLF